MTDNSPMVPDAPKQNITKTQVLLALAIVVLSALIFFFATSLWALYRPKATVVHTPTTNSENTNTVVPSANTHTTQQTNTNTVSNAKPVQTNTTPTNSTPTNQPPVAIEPQPASVAVLREKYKLPKDQYTNKVVQLMYFPTKDGTHIDLKEIPWFHYPTVTEAASVVASLSAQLVDHLAQATTYRHDTTQQPFIVRQVIKSYTYLTPVPKAANGFADHRKMLDNIDVCDYVDRQGVKEFWVWMYHTEKIAPIESNMSMGTLAKAYWNRGGYGDISNSYGDNDLPTCAHTYLVYDFNNDRELGTMLENYGHQLEATMLALNYDLYENHFKSPLGKTGGVVNACGNVHMPPNTTKDYDWMNTRVVKSNCDDWHPDGSGKVTEVSCLTWTCDSDSGTTWKVWWMQHIPGHNNTLTFNGKPLRNFWEFIADFDAAMRLGNDMVIQQAN